MIKKIILFLDWPFCQRDYERFGIKILHENGFDVEVWEFTPYLHKNFYKEICPPDPINYKSRRVFYKLSEIKAAISNLNNKCFVISMILYRPDTFFIFLFLSKKAIKYAIYNAGSCYPCVNKKLKNETQYKTLFTRIKTKLKTLSFDSVREKVILSLPAQFLGIRPADLIFTGAAKSRFYGCLIGKKTIILWIHYLDYDIYLKEIKKEDYPVSNTVVFLDENMPFARDWFFCKVNSPIAPEDYYPSLCNFFDYLERSYPVKIIIAAHPRSSYESLPDYFGSRPVIRGQTASLVKKSKFVLVHDSYSTNYAILFKKPIIFITTNKLNQTFMKNFINGMAESIEKKPINLDDSFEFNLENELKVDEEKYNYYRHCYIKKDGTEELPFWQIVANQIKKY